MHILQILIGAIFIVFGVSNVLLFGSPIHKRDPARDRAPVEAQAIYFNAKRWNTIIGVILTLAGFYIINW